MASLSSGKNEAAKEWEVVNKESVCNIIYILAFLRHLFDRLG